MVSEVPQPEQELDETVAGSHPRAVDDVARTAASGDGAASGVLERGTLLDENFEVVELLGRGAMGAVYLVKHRALGKESAAKVVARAGGLDPAAVARLRNEARMASAIDHENIVGVTHLGTLPDGSVFVVMERLRGEDLRARMAGAVRIPRWPRVRSRRAPTVAARTVAVFRSMSTTCAHDRRCR